MIHRPTARSALALLATLVATTVAGTGAASAAGPPHPVTPAVTSPQAAPAWKAAGWTQDFTVRATGKVFHVDAATGDDSGPGTAAHPWRTLQKAAGTAVAGQKVFVHRGRYTGRVEIGHSGRPGAWIVLRAAPGDARKVVLDGGGVVVDRKSYVKVAGLTVQHVRGADGVLVQGPAHHVVISGNHTVDTEGSGILATGGVWQVSEPDDAVTHLVIRKNDVELGNNGGFNENITVTNGVSRFEIVGNKVHHPGDVTNGGEGIDAKYGARHGSIHGNEVFGLERNPIYLDAATRYVSDVDVYRNRVHDNLSGGISVAKEGNGRISRITVRRNQVWMNPFGGAALYVHPNDSGRDVDRVRFQHNILYGNGRFGISVNYPGATNVEVLDNQAVANDNDLAVDTAVAVSSGNSTVDPGWVDPAHGDFRLKP